MSCCYYRVLDFYHRLEKNVKIALFSRLLYIAFLINICLNLLNCSKEYTLTFYFIAIANAMSTFVSICHICEVILRNIVSKYSFLFVADLACNLSIFSYTIAYFALLKEGKINYLVCEYIFVISYLVFYCFIILMTLILLSYSCSQDSNEEELTLMNNKTTTYGGD